MEKMKSKWILNKKEINIVATISGVLTIVLLFFYVRFTEHAEDPIYILTSLTAIIIGAMLCRSILIFFFRAISTFERPVTSNKSTSATIVSVVYSKMYNLSRNIFFQRIKINLVRRLLSKNRYEETLSNLADLKYELQQEGKGKWQIRRQLFIQKITILWFAIKEKVRSSFSSKKEIQD